MRYDSRLGRYDGKPRPGGLRSTLCVSSQVMLWSVEPLNYKLLTLCFGRIFPYSDNVYSVVGILGWM